MQENRLIIFALVLTTCFVLQSWRPRRAIKEPHSRHLHNFGLMLVGSFLVWLLLPAGAIAAALFASKHNFGLLPFFGAPWPAVVDIGIGVILLDAAIYWQHRAMHHWPLLWRIHRVHHSDLAIDASTGVRFHPVEIVLSMAYKMLVVSLLGISPFAVLCYEVILSSFALFNHSNWAMPGDRVLRRLLVTPDVHRVHHSVKPSETNSNYGNFLLIWDRIFGSYRPQPSAGHKKMQIGLEQFRQANDQKLLSLIANPLK